MFVNVCKDDMSESIEKKLPTKSFVSQIRNDDTSSSINFLTRVTGIGYERLLATYTALHLHDMSHGFLSLSIVIFILCCSLFYCPFNYPNPLSLGQLLQESSLKRE